MNFPKEIIDNFRDAYKQDFGEELSDQDARDLFGRLVRLVSTVLYGAPGKQEN